ncbi:MAG TPA: MBL fold metallo-hydrolase [Myxococcales bacterium]|nr:MBL fold metallo-hydrolase [Myxococcales bacterium]
MRRVIALGSADAFSSAGRGNTAWLVEDGGALCAVDLGPTALLALRKLGRDPQELRAVHFTHLHGDHIAGWPFLLVDAVYRARRQDPLAVTGPPGTSDRLRALWAACYADAAAKDLPFPLEVRELAPGDGAEVCGRRIEALRAQHQRPPHVALSLRLHGPAGVLAFTGDTGPHPGLADLARGATLLCAECTDLRTPPLASSGASPDYPPDAGRRHLSWDDLRALLPAVGVRRIALGHLGPEARGAAARIEAEARELGVDLRVCDDLAQIDL